MLRAHLPATVAAVEMINHQLAPQLDIATLLENPVAEHAVTSLPSGDIELVWLETHLFLSLIGEVVKQVVPYRRALVHECVSLLSLCPLSIEHKELPRVLVLKVAECLLLQIKLRELTQLVLSQLLGSVGTRMQEVHWE